MGRVNKLKVEGTKLNAICDFCLNEGKIHRLISTYRSYRFLNICPKCLSKIRKEFRKK